jgi:FixJ family two-component response regulator
MSSSSPVNKAPLVAVVDDDAAVREALASLLRSAGLRVRTYRSAREFLTHSHEDPPRCLVLDVCLPGLSGLDLQCELQRLEHCMPIVFISGQGDVPSSVQAMKGGAFEFLIKPFNDRDLLGAVLQAIERDRVERLRGADRAALRVR